MLEHVQTRAETLGDLDWIASIDSTIATGLRHPDVCLRRSVQHDVTRGIRQDGMLQSMDELDETPRARNDEQVWDALRASHAAYMATTSPAHDEVLYEVAERIQATASIGKADMGALLFWRRLQADTPWVRDLMSMQDMKVRAVTERAVSAVNDLLLSVPHAASAGRHALSPLPGFEKGDAFASALLFAAAPLRMAVYDRRAHAGLEALGRTLSAAPGRYKRYMELVEDLRSIAQRHGDGWTARDVNVALYWLGGPNGAAAGQFLSDRGAVCMT